MNKKHDFGIKQPILMGKICSKLDVATIIVLSLLFLFFSAIVLMRSSSLAITIDEAITANTFIPFQFWEIATNRHPSANNHILNTILAKLFSNDGTWLLGIRIPAYLGFVIYYWGVIKLTKQLFENIIVQVICFILFFLNLHLIDFFSLSRGYSIAIGAEIWMLVSMLSFLKPGQQNKRNLLILLFWTGIMIYANYSFLNMALSSLIIFVLFYNRYYRAKFLYYLKGSKLIVILSSLWILMPIVPLVMTHALTYGGKNNFWSDTVMDTAFYGLNLDEKRMFVIVTIICIMLLTYLASVLLQFYRQQHFQPEFLIICIIVVWVLLVNIEFYLFKIPFPTQRTALCFFPFLVLLFAFILDRIYRYKQLRFINYILPFLLIGFAIQNFSFYRTKDWANDNFSKRIAQIIYENTSNQKCAIQSHWLFEPAIRYHLKLIKPSISFTIKEKDSAADFIIDWPAQMQNPTQYLFIDKEMPMGLRKSNRFDP
jgi:hypothetical protein